VRHFDYEGAGHAIVFPYVPTTQLVYAHPVSGRISTGGGEPRANARADAQSWAAVRRFLADAVAARGASVPDSRSLSSMDFTPAHDVVDQVAGLNGGDATYALRHEREKVATASQGSYDALFDAALPGLSLGERLLVALYACRLTPAPELAEHYRAQLAGTTVDAAALLAVDHGDAETLADPRLHAILAFTRTLIERPIEGDRDALLRLPAAGLATADVVTLAQLIAFLSYQTRLVAGLRALREATGTDTSTASTETAV
jgi:uncharacterized protein YciW